MRQFRPAAAFLTVLTIVASFAASTALQAAEDAEKAPVRIQGGYVAGVQYMDMDGLTKKAYVSGLIEGMLLAPAFGAPEENMEWFYVCTQEMGQDEIRKLLFEYIKDDHDLWEDQNPAKNFRAIYQACLARVKPDGAKDGEAESGEAEDKKADE